ncbi:MAG TPA: phosphoribosylanthranilate isomerase [Haliangiales bacterium]|nr:phosphoribosylanthranilate isomerase [Haliangiales bacterium]
MMVKICGITRIEDARVAVAAGADWIGVNLWPRSRRYVPLERAREIAAAAAGVVRVAVFVNAPRADIEAALAFVDLVQLHGDETPADCAPFAGRLVRALRAPDAAAMDAFPTDLILLDTPSPGYGGSGRTFDWSLAAAAVARGKRVILAGGLDPDNVAAAVRAVRPFGVDVASGVEAAPGIKDADKVRRFVAAAKAAKETA